MKTSGKIIFAAALSALVSVQAAQGQTLTTVVSDKVMYGINRVDGHLHRRHFAQNTNTDVGQIRLTNGTRLLGLDGAAYVPGHRNIISFWTDPADGEERLVYIDTQSGLSAVVGNSLGKGHVFGAATVPDATEPDGKHFNVYAVQKVEADEDDGVSFSIVNDTVVTNQVAVAKVTVLGAAISYGTSYKMPVTTRFKAGGVYYEPFGVYTKPVSATVNDNKNPRSFIFPTTLAAGARIDVIGRSWNKKSSSYSGNLDSHWQAYMSVDGSTANSPQVIVLRNGSNVPNIQGFNNQANIATFVRDFVNTSTNKVVLDENQAIFLFELGTTSLSSAAADFQDLVVLVTLAKNISDFDEADDDDGNNGPSSRLLKVDHITGGYEQVMTLDQAYDSLASLDGQTFYGSVGNKLYRINASAQTETLVGTISSAHVASLEFVGSTLVAYEVNGGALLKVDTTSGGASGTAVSTGLLNLGTIVFTPAIADPTGKAEMFD